MARKKRPSADSERVKSTELRSSSEWRELVYDYYKQLLTLGTAGIAVVLAVFEQDMLERNLVKASMGNFALCAFLALLGMMRHVGWFPYQREQRRPYMPTLALAATFTMITAVALIVAEVVDPPGWLVHIGLGVALVALVSVLFGDRIQGVLRRGSR